jgi:cytochrome b
MDSPVIWGRSIRCLHWMIAGGLVLNGFVLEPGDPPHKWMGYGLVGLVICRLILGCVGKSHGAFVQWPITASEIRRFAHTQRHGMTIDYPGHNPLACYVYLSIWLLVLLQGVSGWLMGLDAFWGEEWLQEAHGWSARMLLGLALLHLLGMGMDAHRFKRATWMAMITGRRSSKTP